MMMVDETNFNINANANFADNFSSVFDYGADDAGSVVSAYVLSLNASDPTGLVDVATGEDVILSMNGNVVEGRSEISDLLVFTFSVNNSGVATLDQIRALQHPDANNPNDPVSLDSDLIKLTRTDTITDKDGDSSSDSAALNIGTSLVFKDDGPSINIRSINNNVPQLIVDETNLSIDDSKDYSSNFTTVNSDFGADNAGTTSTNYVLQINGGNGTDSGLDDVLSGEDVILSMNGGVVEGRTAIGDELVFTTSVDANGVVTLDQIRPLVHPDATDPDDAVTLSNDNLIQLKRTDTIIDKDGDTAEDSATLNIGQDLIFHDDGPMANDDCIEVVKPPLPSYNLTFTIDISGSMGDTIPNTGGKSRLDIVKEALTNQGALLDSYEDASAALRISIITFSGNNNGNDSDDAWTSLEFDNAQDAKDYVNALNSESWTNYRAALNETTADILSDASDSSLDGFIDRNYWLSDGSPQPANNELTNQEESAWQVLIDQNSIDTVILNIAPSGNQSDVNEFLEPLANPTDMPLVIEVEPDLSNLGDILLDTIDPIEVNGNLLANDESGADKPINLINIQFALDNNQAAQDYLDGHPELIGATRDGSVITIPIPNEEIETPLGATLKVESNGDYTYEIINSNDNNGTDELLYTIVDADGDPSTAEFAFKVSEAPGIIIGDATATEGVDPTIEFLVTLTVPSTEDVVIEYQVVNGTALNGPDYLNDIILTNTITIPAGETSGIIPFSVVDDEFMEPTESFTVHLLNAETVSNNPVQILDPTGVGLIFDDEINANSDGFDNEMFMVYEEGLDHGTNPDPNTRMVTGNLLLNDDFGENTGFISAVMFDGQTEVAVNGIITIDSDLGQLIVYTEDQGSNSAGDFKYTLLTDGTHPDANGNNIILEDFEYTLTNNLGNSDDASLRIKIVDDVPTLDIHSDIGNDMLVVDETELGVDASNDFSDNFSLNEQFGADGPGSLNTEYSLSVLSPNVNSGIEDTLTGEDVLLSMNGNVVEGRTANSNLLVFTVTVDTSSGEVSLDQIRAVVHDDPLDPDEASSPTTLSSANLIKLTLDAEITDSDGDMTTESETLNIGQTFKFEDDGPIANEGCEMVLESTKQPHNFIFVIDTSGSMGNDIPGENFNRLDKIQEALTQNDGVFDSIEDNTSAFVITIIEFNANAGTPIEFDSIQDAKDYVNGLSAGGVTNYKDAIETTTGTINADAADPSLDDYVDVVYFMSDGEPNPSSSGLSSADVQAWQDTLDNNNVNAIIVDIASNGALDDLQELANPSDNPLVLQIDSDLSNVDDILAFDFQLNSFDGNIQDNVDIGADEGFMMVSITFEFDSNQDAQTYLSDHPGLAGAIQNGDDVVISNFNQEIPTPLGGVLKMNIDGTYTYTAPFNVDGNDIEPAHDDFLYTIKDGDGDMATGLQQIKVEDGDDVVRITDLTPKQQGGDAVVDEEHLPDGTNPNANQTTVEGNFKVSAPDGVDDVTIGAQPVISNGVFTAISFATPLGNTLSITGYNANTGVISYEYTLNDNEAHPNANGENNIFEDFAVTLKDTDDDTDQDTLSIRIIDDVPTLDIHSDIGNDMLVVDETELGVDASNDFSDNFSLNEQFGADGSGSLNTEYSLSVLSPNVNSGIEDTLTGEDVLLSMNGDVVEGRTANSNLLVFTVAVDTSSGEVSLDQIRAVVHDDPLDPDEASSPTTLSSANLIRLTLDAEITDSDGDMTTGSETLNIGQTFKFEDDGPIANEGCEMVLESTKQPHNFIFVIDTSGSMGEEIQGENFNRLDKIQEALTQNDGVFDSIESNTSAFVITIIEFNSDAGTPMEFYSIQDAKDYVNSLNADGVTNYKDAIATATNAIEDDAADPALDEFVDVVYYMSDGEPFPADSNSLSPAEVQDWQDTLDNNNVNAIIVDIASNGALDDLQELANPSDNPLVLQIDSDLSNVDDILAFDFQVNSFDGNIQDNVDIGADEGFMMVSITFEFDSNQEAQDYLSNHPGLAGAIQNGDDVVISNFNQEIPTPLGGVLEMNIDGTYTYTAPFNVDGNTLEPAHDDFLYTIKDGDGDLATGLQQVKVEDGDDVVRITDLTPKSQGGDAVVNEEHLSDGTNPDANQTTVEGTFTISAPDGVDDVTVGGQPVITNGVFAAISFATPLGNMLSINAYDANTGVITYDYTLNDNEDHPDANGENSLFEDFTVTLKDVDNDVAQDTLSIRIIDDVPTAVSDSIDVLVPPQPSYNLTFTIDISGSMGEEIGNTNKSRLDIVKEALTNKNALLDSYEDASSALKITIVTFSGNNNGNDHDDAWTSSEFNNIQDAKNYINNLDDESWTNYRAAINETTADINNDASDNSLDGFIDRVYWLSDGVPAPDNNELTNQEEQGWRDLLANNDVEAFVLNIAPAGNQSDVNEHLGPLTNTNNENDVFEVESDLSNLEQILIDTIDSVEVNGNLLANDISGADEPIKIIDIQFDLGSNLDARDYLDDHPELNGATRNGSVIIIPIPDNENIETPLGAMLTVESNGDFTYDQNGAPIGTDTFSYTIEDNDGDQSTVESAFNIMPAPLTQTQSFLASSSDDDSSEISGNVIGNQNASNDINITDVSISGFLTVKNGSVLTIQTNMGILTLHTENTQNANKGDYTYSLLSSAALGLINNSSNVDSFELSMELESDDSKSGVSTLDIKLVNDMPEATINYDLVNELTGHIPTNDDLQSIPPTPLDPSATNSFIANDDVSWVEANSDVYGNLIDNDLHGQEGAELTQISIETFNANHYANIAQYYGIDATADANGTTVHIAVPENGNDVQIITPLGATLTINKLGEFDYQAGNASQDQVESLSYSLKDLASGNVTSAHLEVNILSEPGSLLNLLGTTGPDALTTANKNVNAIVMQGGDGVDEFIIDLNKNDAPDTVYVKDLGINGANKLTFINVDDADNDGESTFADAVESFTQDGENANVEVTLANDTTLIFEDIGTVQGNDVQALQNHLEQIAAEVNIQH